MAAKRDLLVLTNALTDLVRSSSEEEVARRGLKRGHAQLNEGAFRPEDRAGVVLVHGGSPGNVAAGAASLGSTCGMIGAVGTDDIGDAYIRDAEERGIENFLQKREGPTGVCWVLVTPDGERTMAVDLGVSSRFAIDPEPFSRYRLFHVSGYELVSNPEAVWRAIGCARAAGAAFSFDVADAEMVRLRPDDLHRAAGMAEILFANETEARALTGEGAEQALRILGKPGKHVVVKIGARGSLVRGGGKEWRVAARTARVVDTTGAGDGYAAGFLSAFLRGAAPEECGIQGSVFAGRICGIEGARLPVEKKGPADRPPALECPSGSR